MCRVLHSIFQAVVCVIQMVLRVVTTVVLAVENMIRMILQTFYNFVSFALQLISLIPICFVFLLTARLKCFMCGSAGGGFNNGRGGICDCLIAIVAICLLYYILRATGNLDKILNEFGYVKSQNATTLPDNAIENTPTFSDYETLPDLIDANDTSDINDVEQTNTEQFLDVTTKLYSKHIGRRNNKTTILYYMV